MRKNNLITLRFNDEKLTEQAMILFLNETPNKSKIIKKALSESKEFQRWLKLNGKALINAEIDKITSKNEKTILNHTQEHKNDLKGKLNALELKTEAKRIYKQWIETKDRNFLTDFFKIRTELEKIIGEEETKKFCLSENIPA